MKRIIYSLLMLFIAVTIGYGQQSISGALMDADNGQPLIGATVVVQGTTIGTITDAMGKFSLEVPTGYNLIDVQYIGYASETYTLDQIRAGSLKLGPDAYGLDEVVVTGTMDIVRDRRTPVAVSTINKAEIQAKAVGNVELPEAIKNTPSVYVSNQTGFGDSQMFLRGFNQINTAFLFNGQPINGMEDGRMYWSNWSGVSDISNAIQVQRGLGSSKLAISSVGGTVNFAIKTVDKRKGGFVRLMGGNGDYLKGTVAYNSGLQGKWAFSVLLDHWQANSKWADGTNGKGQNYFMSVGFKPNAKHNFNFMVTGAPQWHGQRWSQSKETLAATPKNNQHWGEYKGEFETERRNYYHKPILNLSWNWNVSDLSKISSVAYASFGRGGGTGNYGSSRNRVRREDGQIDWDAIDVANTADEDGIGSFSENYALRNSVNNHQWFGNVTTYEHDFSENLTFNLGADLRFYTGDHFRTLTQLFGLDGYQDSFQHETRGSDYVVSNTYDARPWSALFDIAPEEDRIDYDYSETINYQGVFTQFEYKKEVFSAFVQGAVSNQSYEREGRWSDIGTSDKVSKVGYNVKAGASFNLGEMSTIFANGGYYSRQPFLDNIFENVRASNTLISPDVDNEDVTGVELGYKFQSNKVRANVNLYSTTWGNRTRANSFNNDAGTPDDDTDDFQQRDIERGIEQNHVGLEIDLQYIFRDKLRLSGFTSIGNWTFNAIESLTQFNDDTGEIIAQIDGENIDGVHITGVPQFSFGLGAKYDITEGFDIYADYNFYDNIYERGRDDILSEDIGTLDAYGILDAGASYKFGVGSSNNAIVIRANVHNLLDNDAFNANDRFGFFTLNGTTWNTSVQLLF